MSRAKLAEAFLTAVCDDFAAHGVEAIRRAREADPAGYLRLTASVIPKHIGLDDASDLSALTDQELDIRIQELVRQIADEDGGNTGSKRPN